MTRSMYTFLYRPLYFSVYHSSLQSVARHSLPVYPKDIPAHLSLSFRIQKWRLIYWQHRMVNLEIERIAHIVRMKIAVVSAIKDTGRC